MKLTWLWVYPFTVFLFWDWFCSSSKICQNILSLLPSSVCFIYDVSTTTIILENGAMRVHKWLVSLLLAGRDIKDIAFSRLIGCDSFMRLSWLGTWRGRRRRRRLCPWLICAVIVRTLLPLLLLFLLCCCRSSASSTGIQNASRTQPIWESC